MSMNSEKNHHRFVLNASRQGDAKVLKWLLKQDPDLCYASWDPELPKDHLFIHDIRRADIIELIYELRPDILHYEDSKGYLPISYWLYTTHLNKSLAIKLIEESLAGRKDVTKQAYECLCSCTNFIYETGNTRVEIAKWLISQYPEVTEYQDNYGDFLIHRMIHNDCMPIVKFLIKKDSLQLFKKNKEGSYAIPHFRRIDIDYAWPILKKYPQLITAQNNQGLWAMDYAINNDNLQLCEWIMSQVERSPSGGYVLKQPTDLA